MAYHPEMLLALLFYEQKRSRRKAKAGLTGKKPRGRNPEPPGPGPRKTDQVNLTDGESRIMPQTGKGFEQAYNAQAGVDLETMLIVEEHITQCPNDKKEYNKNVKERLRYLIQPSFEG